MRLWPIIPADDGSNPLSLGSNLLLVLFLLILLAVSVAAWRLTLDSERIQQQSELHTRLGDVNREVHTQIDRYFSLLRAGGATLSLLDEISSDDWDRFVANLDLSKNYSNIESLHFISRVPRDDAAQFEQSIRDADYPGFRISSESELGIYCVLTHSALDTGAARGFDSCQNDIPREVLMAASEHAEPTISQRLAFTPADADVLPADPESTIGFILVAPVFHWKDEGQETPDGWLAIVLMADAIFASIEPWLADYNLEVMDPDAAQPLIFSHGDEDKESAGFLRGNQELSLGNRSWNVELGRAFSSGLLPPLVLFSGVAISLLLFFLLNISYTLRSRAESLAQEMTRAYRESESRRQRTEEISHVMVTHLDVSGHWRKLPPRLCSILKCDEAELIDRPAIEVIHPLDVSVFETACAKLLNGDEVSIQVELRFSPPDNPIVWIEMNLSLVEAASGKPMYFLAFIQNISDRKEWVQELQSRDRLLEAISRSLDFLIAPGEFDRSVVRVLQTIGEAMDVDRAYIFTNHPHARTGLPAHSMRFEWTAEGISQEIDNPDMQDLPYADFPSFWYDRLGQGLPVVARPEELGGESRRLLESQGIKSLLLVPIMMRGGFMGFVGLDDCRTKRHWATSQVTALLAAAASLGNAFDRQDTEEALEHNRRLLSSITDNISEGIYRSTPAGHLAYVNTALASMFGYESSDEMMRIPAPIHYVSPARRKELRDIVDRDGSYRTRRSSFYGGTGQDLLRLTVPWKYLTRWKALLIWMASYRI
jgi:PAS domain S-box-containing protein